MVFLLSYWLGFKYQFAQSIATLLCAHGYYIKETDGFTDEATCTHNGTWTKNLTRVQCVDITCPDPGWKLHSVRDGTILRYMSRIQYTCDYGYFIKPGIVKITLQCTYDAHWTPSDTFTCQDKTGRGFNLWKNDYTEWQQFFRLWKQALQSYSGGTC